MNRQSLRKSLPAWGAIAFKSAKLLSVLKLMKFTKVLVTASTLAMSTLAYGWVLGPWFGVGFTAMLVIHEMGHVIAMRWKGYPIHLPIFIPFFGAAIFVKDMGDRETEAYIGYGGPLLGSLAAFVCIGAWLLTGSPILLLTAYLGVYLNLLNMIPIRPLDGGRIAQLAGPKLKYVAIALLVGYTLYIGEPALMLLWVFVLQSIKFPTWWRSAIAIIVGVLMVAGFLLGLSQQPLFLNILDVVVVNCMIGMYLSLDHTQAVHVKNVRQLLALAPNFPEAPDRQEYVERLTNDLNRNVLGEDDLRPYPGRSTRAKWLGIYLGSTVVLIAAMVYLVGNLPFH